MYVPYLQKRYYLGLRWLAPVRRQCYNVSLHTDMLKGEEPDPRRQAGLLEYQTSSLNTSAQLNHGFWMMECHSPALWSSMTVALMLPHEPVMHRVSPIE
jgi:hypothetical protein